MTGDQTDVVCALQLGGLFLDKMLYDTMSAIRVIIDRGHHRPFRFRKQRNLFP
jgi:hypothetical protein